MLPLVLFFSGQVRQAVGTTELCPSASYQLGAHNADIEGCGLEECHLRYQDRYPTIESCKAACDARSNCLSFSWAPMNGDQNHQGTTVCGLYDTIFLTGTWGTNQWICGAMKSAGKYIADGQTVSGYNEAYQRAFYEVSVEQTASQIVFDACDSDTAYDHWLHFYDESENLLAEIYSNYDCAHNGAGLTINNVEPGTYYLAVGAWETSAGSYSVSMHCPDCSLCPSGSHRIGASNADILGCGLEGCDARYQDNYPSIESCKAGCDATADCVSFSWAPMDGDQHHPGKTVCTLYATNTPTGTWAPEQWMCGTTKLDDLATWYAPFLKFDRGADEEGYPLSAAETMRYYGVNVVTKDSQHGIENFDLANSETFYEIQACDSGYKIIYRWFYGYQHECMEGGKGEHWADWEQVIVQLDAAQNPLKVTYWQHGEWYTVEWDEVSTEGQHPVAYVGKTSHGSYHNDNDIGGGCGYFYDYRNPNGEADFFRTWNHALHRINEQPFYDYVGEWNWADPTDPGISQDFSETFCSLADCKGTGCNWEDCDERENLIDPRLLIDGGSCIGKDIMAEGWNTVKDTFENGGELAYEFWKDKLGGHDEACDAFSWMEACEEDPWYCMGLWCAKSRGLNIEGAGDNAVPQRVEDRGVNSNVVDLSQNAVYLFVAVALCTLAVSVLNIWVCVKRRQSATKQSYDRVVAYDSQSQIGTDAEDV